MKDKKFLLGFFLGGLMFASGVLASNYMSSDISYTPSDSNWKVSNVAEAINSIELSKTSDNYSTEERVVGTWIDGKPLYQKVVTGTTLSSTGWASINHNISNMDFGMIKSISIGGRTSGFAPDSNGAVAELSSSLVQVWANGSWYHNKNIVVVIIYTKTTDQAVNS